ncbi:MAG: PHB depolymerase family esterase [Planctomycetota bacterium]
MSRARPALVTALVCSALAAPAAAKGKRQELRLREPSPLASTAALRERLGDAVAPTRSELDLGQERFSVYLPTNFAARGRPLGLLVWISPGGTGHVPRAWEPVCDRERLIAIGPEGAFNQVPTPDRIALALTAAHGARQRWPAIDPERVYVGGFSGGGNMACWLQLHYPEVFRGALVFAGCDAYRPIPVPDRPGAHWRGTIPRPSEERLALARTRGWAFLVGERDEEVPKVMVGAVAEALRGDGFGRVSFLPIPDHAHTLPDAGWLERGLKALAAEPGQSPRK